MAMVVSSSRGWESDLGPCMARRVSAIKSLFLSGGRPSSTLVPPLARTRCSLVEAWARGQGVTPERRMVPEVAGAILVGGGGRGGSDGGAKGSAKRAGALARLEGLLWLSGGSGGRGVFCAEETDPMCLLSGSCASAKARVLSADSAMRESIIQVLERSALRVGRECEDAQQLRIALRCLDYLHRRCEGGPHPFLLPRMQGGGGGRGWAVPGSSGQLLRCGGWGLRRGGAQKQRPAFAVHEVGAAVGRSREAAPSFCCA